ncbi:MAG: hypothetical protein QM594_05875 [Niabella sp.]
MKKMKLVCAAFTLSFISFVFTDCGDKKKDIPDPPKPPPNNACNGVNATFSGNIAALIQSKCAGCHKQGGNPDVPFFLENYDQVKARATQIKDAAVTNSRMPKNGPALTAEEKKILGCWIDNGALNN